MPECLNPASITGLDCLQKPQRNGGGFTETFRYDRLFGLLRLSGGAGGLGAVDENPRGKFLIKHEQAFF